MKKMITTFVGSFDGPTVTATCFLPKPQSTADNQPYNYQSIFASQGQYLN